MVLSKFHKEAKVLVGELALKYNMGDCDVNISILPIKKDVPETKDYGPPAQDIAHAICNFYDLKYNRVFSITRKQPFCIVRQVAFYILCNYTKYGCYRIGKIFGRTHSTVIHGSKMIRGLMDVDKDMKEEVGKVVNIIKEMFKIEHNDND